MDILQKYNEENPEASDQIFQCDPSEKYGALTCSLMQFSRGRIQNVRQANYVLMSMATIFFLISLTIFFMSGAGNSTQIVPSPVGDNPLYSK